MAEPPGQPFTAPTDSFDAWDILRENTLRKTFPQVLLAVWFWGLVVNRHLIDSPRFRYEMVPVFLAGAAFYAIVIRRVWGVLPRNRFPRWAVSFWFLFMGYTLWLGFAPPVHKNDVREWLGWLAMASGLIACLFMVVPSLPPG